MVDIMKFDIFSVGNLDVDGGTSCGETYRHQSGSRRPSASLATCAERHQFSVNDNYHSRHRDIIINKNDNNSHIIFSIHINSNVDDNGVSAMSTRAATAKATFF
jgi:hypothetical protein